MLSSRQDREEMSSWPLRAFVSSTGKSATRKRLNYISAFHFSEYSYQNTQLIYIQHFKLWYSCDEKKFPNIPTSNTSNILGKLKRKFCNVLRGQCHDLWHLQSYSFQNLSWKLKRCHKNNQYFDKNRTSTLFIFLFTLLLLSMSHYSRVLPRFHQSLFIQPPCTGDYRAWTIPKLDQGLS